MCNMKEYMDIIAFHPGYYIAEYIATTGIKHAKFAKNLDISEVLLGKLLDGQLDITDELAMKIANVVGTSAAFWINLQKAYNEKMRLIYEMESEK